MIRVVLDPNLLPRAVVDTNILIRALINPLGTVAPIIPRLAEREYVIVYSQPLLQEFEEKMALPRLRVKYDIQEQNIKALKDAILLRGELVTPTEKITICRDPDDNMLLEAAVAGNADYIVTGDEDLLVLEKYRTIRIVIPSAFLRVLDSK